MGAGKWRSPPALETDGCAFADQEIDEISQRRQPAGSIAEQEDSDNSEIEEESEDAETEPDSESDEEMMPERPMKKRRTRGGAVQDGKRVV